MSNVGAFYYADPYYQSEDYQSKLRAAKEIERARQALLRGEATRETLAYARFLNAVDNDATMSHGTFKPFRHNDDEVQREWPFLSALVKEGGGG